MRPFCASPAQKARRASKEEGRAAFGGFLVAKGQRGNVKAPGDRAVARVSGWRRPALILHEREAPVAMEIGEAGAPAQALACAHLLLFPGPPSLPSILIASARACSVREKEPPALLKGLRRGAGRATRRQRRQKRGVHTTGPARPCQNQHRLSWERMAEPSDRVSLTPRCLTRALWLRVPTPGTARAALGTC